MAMLLTYIRRICLLIFLMPLPVLAGDAATVIVLNSDGNVARYQAAQAAFVTSLGQPVQTIDLGERAGSAVARRIDDGTVDLIYCIGAKSYLFAVEHASSVKMVFSSTINWRRFPVHTQGYGIANELHPAMQMMLFRYIFPDIKRVGVVYSKQYNREWIGIVKKEAADVGLEIESRAVDSADQALSRLTAILPKIDAYWLISDPLVIAGEKQLKQLLVACDLGGKPVFTYNPLFVRHGATLAVSVDEPTLGRQAAMLAESLLAGRPIDERVSHPAGTHIVLDVKKGRRYNLRIGEGALGSVNQIIE
jgi:putative ABC transport system substrate-binding protein